MSEVYLDNVATTPASPEVAETVKRVLLDDYGNPSSLHHKGVQAHRLVQWARETVARALGVSPGAVLFTSGGTEANNLALAGCAATAPPGRGHLVTTQVEHASVLEMVATLERRGWSVTRVPVSAEGILDVSAFRAALCPETYLVSTMHVNNEVGAVQPLEQVAGELARSRQRPFWHVDAVQSVGKVPLSLRHLPIDLLSLSGHKFHGPKGAGALIRRPEVPLEPGLFGGGQEHGLRSGTENVPGIAGLGRALEELERDKEAPERMARLRRRLLEQLQERLPGLEYNGPREAAPHILNVSMSGLKAEILVNALADRGVAVSSGAACASRARKPSHVLEAMGVSGRRLQGALRFGLSRFTSEDQVREAARALASVVEELAPFHGNWE